MIRLVCFEPMDAEVIEKLTRVIFQAYGLGCEYAGEVAFPEGAKRGEQADPVALLDQAPPVKSFADDKVVYLTSKALVAREVPSGKVPTQGYAQHGGERALLSTHGMPKDPEALLKRLGKQALHDVGHLWELHHCLDPRCAMHPPWAPVFLTGEPALCPFCRDKSEKRIRLAKT